jgi:hypothetical protein
VLSASSTGVREVLARGDREEADRVRAPSLLLMTALIGVSGFPPTLVITW